MDQPITRESSLQPSMQPPAQAIQQPVLAQQVPRPTPQLSAIANPLMKHFRQPAMFISLTSKGQFWTENSLELPANGEIPVYPMTAKDEIILKTPDALVNGSSVVQVIQSCCPNIKDAWGMPSIDVDTTLIAIRIASFGDNMSVSAKCPHCNEEHDYDINLHNVLGQIQPPKYNEPMVTPDGLQIKLRPLTYAQVSQAGNASLEEDRMLQSLANPELSDEVRTIEYNKHIRKMIDINIANTTNCTASIIADGVEVTDPKFISEYYQNAESTVLRQIQTKVKGFSDAVSIKSQDTLCTSCEKQFKLNIEFDYARFFANGS